MSDSVTIHEIIKQKLKGAVLIDGFPSVGLVGTIIGTFLGLIFCWNIETIRKWLESLTGTNLFSAEIYFLSKLIFNFQISHLV